MRPSGRITGEVLDAENRPDPMRSIGLSPRSGRTQISAHTESDAAGRFEFDGVPPGEYSLRTQASEAERELGNHAASNVSQRVEVTVAAGQTAHVVLGGRKRAPVRVSGRISARGRGVAKVTVFASLKSSSKRALTNEDGRYEIALDEPGVYLFNLTLGDSGTRLTRQETVPDALEHAIDFDLPGARIAGRVLTPKGEPARQIEVEMRHSTWADPPSTLRTPFGDVFTGDDGRFAFEHLFAGTYSLHASEALYLGTDQVAQFSPASVETEVAEDATVDDLEIRLEPAGRLDVEVLAPGGERCAGADVFAFGESGAALLHYTGKVTDAAGRMNVTGLPLRDVYVFARKGALASAVVGPVRVGEAELVKLELRPATMLDLSVDTPQGTRPVYASVRNERGIDFARLWSQGGGAIVSGAGGARVGPVPPGRYSVNFANPSPGAQAVDVVVSGEETRAVKLAMPSPPTPND
jgi:hypothetical protein